MVNGSDDANGCSMACPDCNAAPAQCMSRPGDRGVIGQRMRQPRPIAKRRRIAYDVLVQLSRLRSGGKHRIDTNVPAKNGRSERPYEACEIARLDEDEPAFRA